MPSTEEEEKDSSIIMESSDDDESSIIMLSSDIAADIALSSSIIVSSVVTAPWQAASRREADSAAKSFLDIQKEKEGNKILNREYMRCESLKIVIILHFFRDPAYLHAISKICLWVSATSLLSMITPNISLLPCRPESKEQIATL